MGKVVQFVPRDRRVITPPPGGNAEILLFTGVRYEYLRDHPSHRDMREKAGREGAAR